MRAGIIAVAVAAHPWGFRGAIEAARIPSRTPARVPCMMIEEEGIADKNPTESQPMPAPTAITKATPTAHSSPASAVSMVEFWHRELAKAVHGGAVWDDVGVEAALYDSRYLADAARLARLDYPHLFDTSRGEGGEAALTSSKDMEALVSAVVSCSRLVVAHIFVILGAPANRTLLWIESPVCENISAAPGEDSRVHILATHCLAIKYALESALGQRHRAIATAALLWDRYQLEPDLSVELHKALAQRRAELKGAGAKTPWLNFRVFFTLFIGVLVAVLVAYVYVAARGRRDTAEALDAFLFEALPPASPQKKVGPSPSKRSNNASAKPSPSTRPKNTSAKASPSKRPNDELLLEATPKKKVEPSPSKRSNSTSAKKNKQSATANKRPQQPPNAAPGVVKTLFPPPPPPLPVEPTTPKMKTTIVPGVSGTVTVKTGKFIYATTSAETAAFFAQVTLTSELVARDASAFATGEASVAVAASRAAATAAATARAAEHEEALTSAESAARDASAGATAAVSAAVKASRAAADAVRDAERKGIEAVATSAESAARDASASATAAVSAAVKAFRAAAAARDAEREEEAAAKKTAAPAVVASASEAPRRVIARGWSTTTTTTTDIEDLDRLVSRGRSPDREVHRSNSLEAGALGSWRRSILAGALAIPVGQPCAVIFANADSADVAASRRADRSVIGPYKVKVSTGVLRSVNGAAQLFIEEPHGDRRAVLVCTSTACGEAVRATCPRRGALIEALETMNKGGAPCSITHSEIPNTDDGQTDPLFEHVRDLADALEDIGGGSDQQEGVGGGVDNQEGVGGGGVDIQAASVASPGVLGDWGAAVLNQVHYYFNVENLARDIYLRSHMDRLTGYVPIVLLASFPRLRALNCTIADLQRLLPISLYLEVNKAKTDVRLKKHWWDYVLPAGAPTSPLRAP